MGGRWNQLHNWVYILSGFAVLHYLMSPDSIGMLPFATAGPYVWLMGWRVIERSRLGASPRALVLLSVSTAVFQSLWIWLFQHIYQAAFSPFDGDPVHILAANLDFASLQQSGIPPPGWCLLPG